jgi:hypothetical protein
VVVATSAKSLSILARPMTWGPLGPLGPLGPWGAFGGTLGGLWDLVGLVGLRGLGGGPSFMYCDIWPCEL